MSGQRFTAEQVDAAIAALQEDPDRFGHAQEVVTHAAPGLQRILNEALDAGGWFGEAHEKQIAGVVATADAGERAVAMRTLVAEETRLGMLVGVAVGLELAHELYKGEQE
ncbi:MAG TPA: hypothetical protein VFB41_05855 [Solirubrobacteraceae bacterium]|nr:hypothetical protein [Solirubrobacteraceae bacterium]